MYHAMSKDMMPRMQYNLSTIGKAVRWLEFLPSYNHQPTLSTKAASEGNQPPPPWRGRRRCPRRTPPKAAPEAKLLLFGFIFHAKTYDKAAKFRSMEQMNINTIVVAVCISISGRSICHKLGTPSRFGDPSLSSYLCVLEGR